MSSPTQLANDSTTRPVSPVIKRAAVTYGRRRANLVEEADTSMSTLASSSSISRFDITSGLSSANTSFEMSSPRDLDASPPHHHYAWKDRLRAIDDCYDLAADEAHHDLDTSRNITHDSLTSQMLEGSSKDVHLLSNLEDDPLDVASPPRKSVSRYDSDSEGSISRVARKSLPKPVALVPDSLLSTDASSADSALTRPPPYPRRHSNMTPRPAGSPSHPSHDPVSPTLGSAKDQDNSKGPISEDHSPDPAEGDRSQGKLKRKPTKKTKREAQLKSARHNADQAVQIRHTENKKFTIGALFKRLAPNGGVAGTAITKRDAPSDPILPFTSSPTRPFGREARSGPIDTRVPSDGYEEDEDEYLPSVESIRKDAIDRDKSMQLQRKKRQILAAQNPSVQCDDDDDLVIVDDNFTDQGKTRKPLNVIKAAACSGEKRPSRFSGTLAVLRGRGGNAAGEGKGKGPKTMMDLNREVLKKVEEVNAKMVAKKEEEWQKKGGKLKHDDDGPGIEAALRRYAEEAQQIFEVGHAQEYEDEDDGSDGEWVPERSTRNMGPGRGSTSPDPDCQNGNDGDVSEVTLGGDEPSPSHSDDEEDIGDQENQPPALARHLRTAVVSDDEDDEAPRSRSFGRVLVPDTPPVIPFDHRDTPAYRSLMHRRSFSSFDTDDDEEKENDLGRMWDKSEDKENKAIVRHEPLATSSIRSRLESFFESDGFSRDSSPSPDIPSVEGEGLNSEKKPRTPFKELLKRRGDDNDDILLSPASGSPLSPFVQQLTQSENLTQTTLVASPSFKPLLVLNAFGGKGFDEGTDDLGADENTFKSLEPGFGTLFDESTQAPSGLGLFKMEPSSSLSKERRASSPDLEALPLTLDVGLAPALEVSESKRKQADSIFEKEQGYLVEGFQLEMKKKATRQEPEVYVNDHGFLTQTRPDVSSPEVYRMTSLSPTQEQPQRSLYSIRRLDGSQHRAPLQTLSLIVQDSQASPLHGTLKRLRKREAPLLDEEVPLFSAGGYRSSPSPAPSEAPDAFKVLARNAARRQVREKMKLERSEFVEAEAVESDDDEMRGFSGFGKKTDDDEEGNGEDLDGTLEELVDDKEMNEEEVAKVKVLEKHQEHLAEDDKRLEKLHLDAIEGKLRTKRKNRGVGLSDSDEDEEDEEARETRRKLRKKRKIEGDGLEALGEREETLAFYKAYHQPLTDDDDPEFAHLRQNDVDMMDEGDSEEDEHREIVSSHMIRELARQAAQQDEEHEPLNPEDVSWVDGEASDDECRVRVQNSSVAPKRSVHGRQATNETGLGVLELTRKESDRDQARLLAWARSERGTRNGGTARTTAGAAVTGHGRPKVKSGGGSLRAGSSGSSEHRRTVKTKAQSVLLKAMDRSDRFA